jgi:anti-sigma-K factor RskA
VNIGNKPELLDKLCAGYALGTLKGHTRKRLEAYARQSATVRATMLLWQERMVAMIELAPQVEPRPTVWPNIEKRMLEEIAASRTSSPASYVSNTEEVIKNAINNAIARWRRFAIIGGLATTASVLIGWQQYQEVKRIQQSNQQLIAAAKVAPQLRYVAVLADEKSNANILITVDAKNNQIAVQRVGEFKEADEKSLQLWSIPKSGAPTSLSVLDTEKLMRLKVSNALLENSAVLAVSLEVKGGVPSEKGPLGPVLFKGQLLQATM